MNDKIKEFYNESSSSRYVKTDGYGNDHYRKVTNYELFAELIIKECIKIADKRGAYEVMDDIIDHFGVE